MKGIGVVAVVGVSVLTGAGFGRGVQGAEKPMFLEIGEAGRGGVIRMTCSGGKPTIEMTSDEGMVLRMEVGKEAGFRMGKAGRLEEGFAATVDGLGKVQVKLGGGESQSVCLFHEPEFASGITVKSGGLDTASVGLVGAAAIQGEYSLFPSTAQVLLWDGRDPVWHRRSTTGSGLDASPEPVAAPEGESERGR